VAEDNRSDRAGDESAGDGWAKELDWWFTDAVLQPKPEPPNPPKPPLKMADLQPASRQVLMAP